MEISEHIAALQRDGDLLAVAAEQAGPSAEVPSCPAWRVRDLLKHLGYVHRWAAGYVRDARAKPLPGEPGESEVLGRGPADAELLEWFRAGHAALLDALRTGDPKLACWTFLDAPSALAFWARRQAHETAIHRVDAELASGRPSPFPAKFAADGVDELIMGFFGRDAARLSAAELTGRRQRLQVRALDAGKAWQVELTEDGKLAALVRRGEGGADCTLSGPAEGLYLLLWNRADPASAGVEVAGDRAVLRTWQEGMRVTWE